MTQRERDTLIHLIAGGWVLLQSTLFVRNFPLSKYLQHAYDVPVDVNLLCALFWLPKLVSYSFAGTVGAIVTCPLEVVKTRLQSSSSRFYPSPVLDAGNNKTSTNGTQFKGTSHKRDICTSILQKRSQVRKRKWCFSIPYWNNFNIMSLMSCYKRLRKAF